MKICAMTCLHNLALEMIGGSSDKKRFQRNAVVEKHGKKASSLKAKLKAYINTLRQANKPSLHYVLYVCVSKCHIHGYIQWNVIQKSQLL